MADLRFAPGNEVPERLGRYEVLLPIASGGMATVYLAYSTGMAGFEREVAIKLTHSHLRESPEFMTALIDEARLAGRIRHPNVVSVLDVGSTSDAVYIVMDYVEGDSLSGLQRVLKQASGRLPFGVSLKILDDVLSGLHVAHELKDADGVPLEVVHRDVTPHNILVGIDGVSRLADFGVAKAASRFTQTMTGLVKGKIAYMSPEQARGGRLTRTSDVWAAGVVAWELFSGLRLHDGLNDAALIMKVAREPPTPLRHVCRDVPRPLEDVISRALSMRPDDRYPTAEAFAEALARAARGSGIAPADVREVRDLVLPMVSDELEARRIRAARVRGKRRASSPALLLDGLGPARESRPPPAPASPPPEVATATVVEPYTPPAAAPSAGLPTMSERLEPAHVTPSAVRRSDRSDQIGAATSVPPPSLLTAPIRSRVWLWLAFVPLALIAVAWSFSRHDSEPAGGAASASARALAGPAPSAGNSGILTPSELPVEPAPSASVLDPSELPVEPAPSASVLDPSELPEEPAPKPKHGHVPPPRPPTGAAPKPGEPLPLANPYLK